jgi:eukaryotic-like serine/threonine-protein kinase
VPAPQSPFSSDNLHRYQQAVADYVEAELTGVPLSIEEWSRAYGLELEQRLRMFAAARQGLTGGVELSRKPDLPRPSGTLADIEFDGVTKEGRMGIVRRGWDRILDRQVAVKQPKGEYAAKLSHLQFVQEAQRFGQLQQPNIPPVYQFGWDTDDIPFFTMQWIEGSTLSDLRSLERNHENLSRSITIFLQVCQAVGFAHGRKVLHRDLKPEHVIIEKNDAAVFVVDWGIGKSIDGETASTNGEVADPRQCGAGGIAGTPAYMAPEQAIPGEEVGPPADVFGLGGILYFILTGASPVWEGGLADRGLMKDVGSPVRSRLETRRTDYSKLVDLALWCLAKKPSNRPENGVVVAEEVQKYLTGITDQLIFAAQEKAAQREKDQKRANRRKITAIVAVAILSLGIVGGAVFYRQYRLGQRNEEVVSDLLGRCENALRGNDLNTAEAVLAEIERQESGWWTHRSSSRIERCRDHLTLLQDLERIDDLRWMPGDRGVPDKKKLTTKLAEACQRFGIIPGTTSPQESAQRVNSSLLRDRLLGALDLWLMSDPSPELREILAEADRDDYREFIRDAVLAGNEAALVESAGRENVFAQPPHFVSLLGQINVIPVARRRAILELAHAYHRQNLTILMSLSNTYPFDKQEGAENRVRWLQQSTSDHPSSIAAHHNLGLALRDKGDIEGAVREFGAAIKLNPNSALSHNALGSALVEKGSLDAAIFEFKVAMNHDPQFFAPHNGLGDALIRKRDFDGAIAAFQSAIKLDPMSPIPHDGLGRAMKAKGDLREAIQEYRTALKLDTKYAAPYDGLWNAMKAADDVDGAIQEFRTAIEGDPTIAAPYNGLGNALAVKGYLDEAIREFKAAIERDPKFALPHNGLGNALKAKGDLLGAIGEIQVAITLDTKYALAHQDMGIAQWERGDRKRAIEEFRVALTLDQNLAPAQCGLGLGLAHLGDTQGAIQAYRTALDLDRKYAPAHEGLGEALVALGNRNSAIQEFQRAIALNPKRASPHNGLGTALYRNGDPEGAIDEYRTALKLDPKFTIPYINLGNILADKGKLEEANQEYQAALKIDPNCVLPHTTRGNVLWFKANADSACAAYREAVREHSPWVHTYRNLAVILAERGESFAALQILETGLRKYPHFVSHFRYDLACYACQVTSGRAKDIPSQFDRDQLRHKALGWLTAEVEFQQQRAATPANWPAIHQMMQSWLSNPALESVRAAGKLPSDERGRLERLWGDIRKLHDDTANREALPPKR